MSNVFTRKNPGHPTDKSGISGSKSSRYFDFTWVSLPRSRFGLLEAVGLFRYSPGTVGFYDKAILTASACSAIALCPNIVGKKCRCCGHARPMINNIAIRSTEASKGP